MKAPWLPLLRLLRRRVGVGGLAGWGVFDVWDRPEWDRCELVRLDRPELDESDRCELVRREDGPELDVLDPPGEFGSFGATRKEFGCEYVLGVFVNWYCSRRLPCSDVSEYSLFFISNSATSGTVPTGTLALLHNILSKYFRFASSRKEFLYVPFNITFFLRCP